MTAKRLFKLIDQYSRNVHDCLLAEMDVNEQLTAYTLCFCPIRSNLNDPYACRYRYLEIDAEEIHSLNRTRSLPVTIIDLLDTELTLLRLNLLLGVGVTKLRR